MKFKNAMKKIFTENVPIKLLAFALAVVAVILINAV